MNRPVRSTRTEGAVTSTQPLYVIKRKILGLKLAEKAVFGINLTKFKHWFDGVDYGDHAFLVKRISYRHFVIYDQNGVPDLLEPVIAEVNRDGFEMSYGKHSEQGRTCYMQPYGCNRFATMLLRDVNF